MSNFKYSNCLLEAIKAKLKNPKNVKILYIPRGFNLGDTWGHFVWTDATLDVDNQYYFEFCSARNGSNHIWFKGKVSRTKRTDIHRMLNISLARNKKLRKLEKKFDFKFNQGRIEKIQKIIGDSDWQIVDEEFFPLPKITSFPGYINFTSSYYKYEPTELKPKILGRIKGTDTYKNYYFDENGEVITNGDKIDWWRWDFYKEPSAHQSEWKKSTNQ